MKILALVRNKKVTTHRKIMNNSRLTGFFGLTVILGFISLLLPDIIFGRADLWGSVYYYCSFLILVVLIGYFVPNKWWLWPIGIYLGEVAHLGFTIIFYPNSEASAWWQLGIIVITMSLGPIYLAVGLGKLSSFLKSRFYNIK